MIFCKTERCVSLTAWMVIVLMAACTTDKDGRRNIAAYYFPLDELAQGKVYEYEPVSEMNNPTVYWHYKSVRQGGSQFLLGKSYDPAFSPDQFVREERVGNGMLLADFFTFETGEDGKKRPIQAKIDAANVFPFEVKKPFGVLLSSLQYSSGDTATITLVRNRQFDSDTTVVFNGKTLPAVKFNTRELVDQEVKGHLELEFGGMEVYAKNIGLIYFKKNIDGWLMQYRLANIYNTGDFEEKFKIKLDSLQ